MKLATAARNAEAEAFGALFDGGYIEFRSGTIPADPQTTATGSLLISFNMSDPAWAAASGGVISMNLPSIQTITGTGTVSWARAFTALDVVIADFTVGISASDIIVDSVDFITDEGFAMTATTYTQNESNA